MHILMQNLLSINGPVGELFLGFFWGFFFLGGGAYVFIFERNAEICVILRWKEIKNLTNCVFMCVSLYMWITHPSDDGIGLARWCSAKASHLVMPSSSLGAFARH